MANTHKYTLRGSRAAEVDDVRLVPGGEPKDLTDDQVKRLAAAGVTVETEAQKAKREKDESAKREKAAVAPAGPSTTTRPGGDS